MKELIIGLGLMVVFTIVTVFQNEHNIHREQEEGLKALAQEAAAAAAQYFDREDYGDGYYNFIESQGIMAAESVIKSGLRLDGNMKPTSKSYWRNAEQITYNITFVDHNDYSAFPHLSYAYPDPRGNADLPMQLYGPSVIITISTGKAQYTSIPISTDSHQIGMHTLDE